MREAIRINDTNDWIQISIGYGKLGYEEYITVHSFIEKEYKTLLPAYLDRTQKEKDEIESMLINIEATLYIEKYDIFLDTQVVPIYHKPFIDDQAFIIMDYLIPYL